MKKFLLVAATALSLGTATFADTASAAQYNQNRPQMQNQDHGKFDYNGRQFDRMNGPRWNAPQGYHQQSWQRGQRLPSSYNRVVVNDWRARHFAPPPRGYHYVRVGNDVVLAAVASGIIGAVIANAFYN